MVELLEACRTYEADWIEKKLGLSAQGVEALTSRVKGPTSVSARTSLYHAGDGSGSLYVVQQGAFKSYLINGNGDTQVTRFHFRGELVGVDALHSERYNSTATALEASYVFRIPVDEIRELVSLVPGFGRQIVNMMSQRILRDEKHIMLVNDMPAPARLARYLLNVNRRQPNHAEPNMLYLPMNRNDLASYLGLAAETLSRLLTRLSQEGFLAVRDTRHVILLDLDGLQELSVAHER